MPLSRKAFLSLCVLVIGLIAAAGWLWLSPSTPQEKPDDAEAKAARARDVREAHRLVDLKNAALANLENGQFSAADPSFLNLATAGTREPVGARNWTIERLIALASIAGKRDPTAYDEAFKHAQSALNLEIALEPKSPIRHYLAAKLAQVRGLAKQQIFEQHIAAGTAPGDPIQWCELYQAQIASGPKDRKESEGTLKTLKDLAPDNLYAQLEWLAVQARRQDPQIADTLSRIRNLVVPLLSEQRNDAISRLSHLMDESQSAAKAANWEMVQRDVSTLVESAQSLPELDADRLRIEREVSWFLVSDFSNAFYQKHRVDRRLTSSGNPVHFQKVALSEAVADVTDACEARFVDFHLAGRLEIAVLRSSAFEILDRDQNDQWTRTAGIAVPPGGYQHFVAVDLGGVLSAKPPILHDPKSTKPPSQRAALDFVLFGSAGLLVLENRRDTDGRKGELQRVANSLPGQIKDVLSVVARDLDDDGLVDLVVACSQAKTSGSKLRVLRNQGNRRFEDITARSGLSSVPLAGKALVAVDWDNDLDVDLLAAGAGLPGATWGIGFLKGRGLARFRAQPFPAKDADIQSATSLAVLDADANGSWDLVTAGPRGMTLMLTSSIEHGRVETIGVEAISDFVPDSLLAFDYDNDGAQDILAWNRDSVRCFHGSPEGHFEIADALPSSLGAISSADFGDFDNDGDSDLVVVKTTTGTAAGRIVLLRNEGGNSNHWIDVRLDNRPADAQAPNKKGIPRSGLGATVCLKINAVSQTQIVERPVTHFGIGSLDSADVLRILWNTRVPTNVIGPGKNTTMVQAPPTPAPPTRSRP